MPTPITNTSITFTYKVADEIYASTDLQGKIGTAVYTGPDRVWVFVDQNTGSLVSENPPLTSIDDGASVPTPIGTRKIELVAADDPIIMGLIYANRCVTQNQTTTSETMPNGLVRTYNDIPEIAQTYDLAQISYNLATNEWNTPPYLLSPIAWSDVITSRNALLTASDGRIAPDMPDALKTQWTEFRQQLRDLPALYGYGTANEVAAWKVVLPVYPTE